ncbi:survival protein sure-likephosphatase/nucleotidase-like protein [Hypoxylon sp. FL1284]|nr:survival protein sure-likephosphatase/nucleotidase-like protein [Hypoxylon sp. FL1284]
MRTQLILSALPILAHGIRILQSNDDGWAELYIRSLHDELIAAEHDVVLSAPAENKSGSGSLDLEPNPRTQPCEYDSCPASDAPIGRNGSNPRLNWVNSYPATSVRYGLEQIGPDFWDGEKPELVASGPNVGSNIFLSVPFSGTAGAAAFASRAGVPAIAFSGASTGNLAWNATPAPARSTVYAQLATQLVDYVVAQADVGERGLLPDGVWLNVNFPKVDDDGDCAQPDAFRWVLTRINPGVFDPDDVEWCGDTRLPTELKVSLLDGCWASVSVADAEDKTTASTDKQAIVLEKLKPMLSCLPSDS